MSWKITWVYNTFCESPNLHKTFLQKLSKGRWNIDLRKAQIEKYLNFYRYVRLATFSDHFYISENSNLSATVISDKFLSVKQKKKN